MEKWLLSSRGRLSAVAVIYCYITLLPLKETLKEMLFRMGHEVSVYAVLNFASSNDVGDLYLMQPLHNMSLWY